MGSARACSATGLLLLDAQTRVVLAGTAHHQDELRWYAPPVGGPPTQVEVELLLAPIWSGAQAGCWGIEARIDGFRVGELIHPVAGWYGRPVAEAWRHGRRCGAEAHVVIGELGLVEVELYLPVAGPDAMWERAAGGSDHDARPVPLWMGLVAAVLLVMMVASVAMDRISRSDPITALPAADTTLALAAGTPPAPIPPPVTRAAPTTSPPQVTTRTKPRARVSAQRMPLVAATTRPRAAIKRAPSNAKAGAKAKASARASASGVKAGANVSAKAAATPSRVAKLKPDPDPTDTPERTAADPEPDPTSAEPTSSPGASTETGEPDDTDDTGDTGDTTENHEPED